MRRALLAVAVAVVVMCAAGGSALANGRFPATTSVTFQRGSTQNITLGSTIGLLLSKDGGQHFYWVCDQAVFGNNNNMFDPDYKVATDGTLYANTQAGVVISKDGGCTYNTAVIDSGLTNQKWVDAMDLGPADDLWVTQAEGGMPNDVFQTTDGGQTWQSRNLMSTTMWWKSVKVAPSSPADDLTKEVVYVSGYQVTQLLPDGGVQGPAVHLKRSDDGGQTWNELPTSSFVLNSAPLILVEAVSPTDPMTVFAISQVADPPMGDKLYLSTDGGMTWKLVLDTTDPVRDVVFLQDGSVVVATIMGAWQAPSATGTFAPLASPLQLACLSQRTDGEIFGCGANWDPDFMALGTTTSANGPWTAMFRFVQMAGPLNCPAGTPQHDTCALVLWPSVMQQFDIPTPTPDASALDAPAPAKKASGCCESGGSSGVETAVVVVLAIVIGGALFRRGKRKRKCCQ